MEYQVFYDLDEDIRAKFFKVYSMNKHRNVFQSLTIFEFYKKILNWEPLIVITTRSNNDISGFLLALIQRDGNGIFRFLSSRTVIIAGPLLNETDILDGQKIMDILLFGLVKEVKKKTIYIQFRNLFNLSQYSSVFKKYGFKYDGHYNFVVKTNDRVHVHNNISKSKIRQVKKGLKKGAKIIEPKNIDQVREFYLILKNLYKYRIKKPLPGWDFFKYFFNLSLEGQLGKYFFIEYQGKIVGGVMGPITPHLGIYEWYVCGLDKEYPGIYPSVLATWAPINFALESNLEFFDFMGAGAIGENYGVKEFKSKFGGEMVEFGRYNRINYRVLYQLGKLGVGIFSRLT